MGKFRQCLTELSARDTIMAGYYSLTFLLHVTFVTFFFLLFQISLVIAYSLVVVFCFFFCFFFVTIPVHSSRKGCFFDQILLIFFLFLQECICCDTH